MPSLGKQTPYYILKTWVRCALQLFYKVVAIKGAIENPKQGGLLVANHQNTLLDALLLATFLPGKTYFLTRADVVTPKNQKLLEYLGILPIYRQRDGLRQVAKNKALEEKVHDLIQNGARVLIFPEGTHYFGHKIRTFKKGFSRFIPEQGCPITPIALNFENHTKNGGEVLINIAKPVTQKVKQTPENLERIICENALNFSSENEYKACVKAYINSINQGIVPFIPFSKEWQKSSDKYTTPSYLPSLPLSAFTRKNNAVIKLIVLLLSAPLALVGLYYRIITEIIIRSFARFKIKDTDFKPSVSFALKCFIYPPYLLIISLTTLANHKFMWEGWLTIFVILMGCKFVSQ